MRDSMVQRFVANMIRELTLGSNPHHQMITPAEGTVHHEWPLDHWVIKNYTLLIIFFKTNIISFLSALSFFKLFL